MTDPVYFATIDECAEECKKFSTMFAYGTNDFRRRGCTDNVCKCLCIKPHTPDDDNPCESINQEEYWLYKFKNAGKLNITYRINFKLV